MATENAIRAAFQGAVNDERSEELVLWLIKVNARVESIVKIATGERRAPFDILDFTDPGWVLLWEQDSQVDQAVDALRAIDFEFETLWESWRDAGGLAG